MRKTVIGSLTAMVVMAAGAAAAQELEQAVGAPEAIGFLAGDPVSEEVLAEARGGALIGLDGELATLTAEIAGASTVIGNGYSASNSIAADAFSNAAGAFTVIQNNGNNAIIQVNTAISVLVQ